MTVRSSKGVGKAAVQGNRPVEIHVTVTRKSGDVERYLLASGESREWATEMRKRLQRLRLKADKMVARLERLKVVKRRKVS